MRRPSWWTTFVNSLLGSSGISLALDSNAAHTGYQQSTKLFDIFAFLNSGTLTLGTGPAWTNSTTRSAAIAQVNGLWVNNASITLKYDTSASTASVGANKATYLGTMYATADGETGVQFKPAAAVGGTSAIVGIYNAYNQKRITPIVRDDSTYTYNSATWRSMDNSTSNRVTYVDGLQQTAIKSTIQILANTGTASDAYAVGVNLDATTGTPNLVGYATSATATAGDNWQPAIITETFAPQLGLHYVQAMESSASGATANINLNGNTMQLTVDLEY
jgi:hypothetical protein